MKNEKLQYILLILLMLACTACSPRIDDINKETNVAASKKPLAQEEDINSDKSNQKDEIINDKEEMSFDDNEFLIPDPMSFNSDIEYWDVEEIKSHKIKTEKKELRSLEEYYVPAAIPEGWIQDHIQVTEDYVAVFYRPEKLQRGEFNYFDNSYYSFCLYRKVNGKELKERLLSIYKNEYESVVQEEQDCYIINNIERNLKYIYWAEGEKSLFATMPLDANLDEVKNFCKSMLQRVDVDNSDYGNQNEGILIPDPMSNNPLICYADIEELISHYIKTEKEELRSLEEYYVPAAIPEGCVQDHIQVTENFVAVFYRPEAYKKGEFDFNNNPYYSFCLNRKEKDSEINDRLLATYGDKYDDVVQQERDYYIVDDVEKNLKYIYWAERGKSHFATMPLDTTLDEIKAFCRTEIQRVKPWTTPSLDDISYANEEELKERIQKGDREELKELTEYFVSKTIPDGWVADHIRVKEYYATIYYRPSDYEEGKYEGVNNPYYSFCWYRTESESDIEDNLWRIYEKDYKNVVTEIDNFYIVDNEQTKIKSIYWAQDGNSFFAKMPIDVTLEEIRSFCDAKEIKLID